eukprot:TRINITY_DN7687_c1_g1_i1.p1 TRINITY_DN7687_c1_g1~~TRINITY_DN7687_c1_g1_i1.p1  ORF type:complete len:1570 (+),score=573.91 TRINITY_DN7687_c1_g1_i1:67-4710(+)
MPLSSIGSGALGARRPSGPPTAAGLPARRGATSPPRPALRSGVAATGSRAPAGQRWGPLGGARPASPAADAAQHGATPLADSGAGGGGVLSGGGGVDYKDMRIRECQEQIAELLKYKEQAFNYRADVVILQEKLRIREDDQQKLTSGIQDMLERDDDTRAALHERCVRYEKATDMLKRSYADKVQCLEAHIQALKEDSDRHGRTNAMLQQELVEMQRAAQKERAAHEERELELRQAAERAAGDSQRLRAQLQEQGAAAARAEAAAQACRRDLQERDALLRGAAATEAAVRRHDAEQNARIGELSAQVAQLEERNRRLAADAEVIPALRGELAELARVRQELEVGHQQQRMLEEQLQREHDARQQAAEEAGRHRARLDEAEQRASGLRAQLSAAEARAAELGDAARSAEALRRELHGEQQRAQRLQGEAERERGERIAAEERRSAAAAALDRELANAAAVLTATMEDQQPAQLGALAESFAPAGALDQGTAQVVADLRTRCVALCAECARLRQACESSRDNATSQKTLAQQLTRDRDELARDREELLARHEDQKRAARGAEEQARRTETELSVARSEIEALKNQLRSRSESLLRALQQHQQPAAVPGAEEGAERDDDPPPVLRLASPAEDAKALSYDTLVWKLTDSLTAQEQYVGRLRAKCAGLAKRCAEAEDQAAESRRRAAGQQDEMRAQLRAEEDRRLRELRQQKEQLDEWCQQQVSAVTLKLRGAERAAAQLRAEQRDRDQELQQARAEDDRQQQAQRRLSAELEQAQGRLREAEERLLTAESEAAAREGAAAAVEEEVAALRGQAEIAEAELLRKEGLLQQSLESLEALRARSAEQQRAAQEAEETARREAEELGLRLGEAEREARAQLQQSQHWQQELQRCTADLQAAQAQCGRAAELRDTKRLEAARLWECARLLARGAVPLREQCRELLAQRRVLLLWGRELELALETLRSETRRALADAGVEQPRVSGWRSASGVQVSSLRSVALCFAAARRLARLPARGRGKCSRVASGMGGERVCLLPVDSVAPAAPQPTPYPPPGAHVWQGDPDGDTPGALEWTTSAQEDADGFVALLRSFAAPGQPLPRGAAPPGGSWDTAWLQRLGNGLAAFASHMRRPAPAITQSPLQQARSTARQVGQWLRELRAQSAEAAAREERCRQDRQAEQQRAAKLTAALQAKEEMIATLQRKSDQLALERSRMVPSDEVAQISRQLDQQRVQLQTAEEQGEELRRALQLERRSSHELSARHAELADAHDRARRALEIKEDESRQLTDYLQLRAQQTVSSQREYTVQLAEVRSELDRRGEEVSHLSTALKRRTQEARGLHEQLDDYTARQHPPTSSRRQSAASAGSGALESPPRRRPPARPAGGYSAGDRVRVRVAGELNTWRGGTVVCGSQAGEHPYVRLDDAVGAARYAPQDVRPEPPPAVGEMGREYGGDLSVAAATLLPEWPRASAGRGRVGQMLDFSGASTDPVDDVASYIRRREEEVERTIRMSRTLDAGRPGASMRASSGPGSQGGSSRGPTPGGTGTPPLITVTEETPR